jgi:hypothetical protein
MNNTLFYELDKFLTIKCSAQNTDFDKIICHKIYQE